MPASRARLSEALGAVATIAEQASAAAEQVAAASQELSAQVQQLDVIAHRLEGNARQVLEAVEVFNLADLDRSDINVRRPALATVGERRKQVPVPA